MVALCGVRPVERSDESPAAKPEVVDGAEMAHKEWQAILEDWRKVPARKGDQVAESSRVRSDDQGKAGREEKWQAVRRATKTHSPEDREV